MKNILIYVCSASKAKSEYNYFSLIVPDLLSRIMLCDTTTNMISFGIAIIVDDACLPILFCTVVVLSWYESCCDTSLVVIRVVFIDRIDRRNRNLLDIKIKMNISEGCFLLAVRSSFVIVHVHTISYQEYIVYIRTFAGFAHSLLQSCTEHKHTVVSFIKHQSILKI